MKPLVLDAAYAKPISELEGYTVITTVLPCHPWSYDYTSDNPHPGLVKPYCDAIQPMVDWVRTRTFKADDAYMFEEKYPLVLGRITVAYWFFSPARAADALLFKLAFGGS
ncbi:hypothetical protein [Caulobacter sp. FWC2]|uniref:hypothetical protein n=1 Tax=Caulobacter sp. FWC2 TaxID=69664 RepID=UPI000C155B80|nr:hypothetical protein [Caulobacter sp. FWC2]PIB90975.1 hypothetical protein CSW62_04965 [Caulobacter sp. FWC2]